MFRPIATAILTAAVFTGSFFASGVAAAKSYPPSYDRRCIANRHDAFDLGWSFPAPSFSRYRGQCLDTSGKRPAVLLKAEKNEIRFANFLYHGRFYVATLRPDAVAKIYFNIEEFQPLLGVIRAAHTQLRFFLKPGRALELIPQTGRGRSVSLRDFVVSAEYMAPKGVPYSGVRGMGEVFMNVIRFAATYDRVQWQIVTNHDTVRQFELDLPARSRDRVLHAAVALSAQKGITDVYNTVSLNCTTEAFRILYTGLGRGVPNPPWRPGSLFDPVVGSTLRQLGAMGLINPTSERPTLNEEFAGRG